MKIALKKIVDLKKCRIFALQIATFMVRFLDTNSCSANNNTPLMPLLDAHLRGFFFWGYE
jgi:hypothetical protein